MMAKKEYFVNVPDPRNPSRMVKGKIVNFKVLKEDWNEYELEDGTIVQVKPVVQSISYVIDPETNEIIKTPTGEPVINVRHAVVINAIFPEQKGGEES